MITLYTWSTPNGLKISIALEEMNLAYAVQPVNIGQGEQFNPDFLAISPNNKIPAIQDGSVAVFESAAILIYLARKSGLFLAAESTDTYWKTMEWLMWQTGGFGPMLGQAHHFLHHHPEKSDYAATRYHTEAKRLYRVLDQRLSESEYLVSEISIADFAVWPWVSRFEYQHIDLNDYPNIKRWYLALASRPAFSRGYAQPIDVNPIPLPGSV